MQIPIKIDYGVRALVDLALHAEDGAIRAAEIAERTGIPEPYLAQVLHTLGKGGIIKGHRGPKGGHILAIQPSDIRLTMVMACLSKPTTVIGCLEDTSFCIHVPSCAQREVWRKVEEAVFQILDSTTIADLVSRTRSIQSTNRPNVQPRTVTTTYSVRHDIQKPIIQNPINMI